MWTDKNFQPDNTSRQGAKGNIPFMNTMVEVMNKSVRMGYVDNFKVTKRGLYSLAKSRYYRPEQVKVVNFYRFEGQSDPADNSILYLIETTDGQKGTLTDSYGAYADASVNAFIQEVENIETKINDSQKGHC